MPRRSFRAGNAQSTVAKQHHKTQPHLHFCWSVVQNLATRHLLRMPSARYCFKYRRIFCWDSCRTQDRRECSVLAQAFLQMMLYSLPLFRPSLYTSCICTKMLVHHSTSMTAFAPNALSGESYKCNDFASSSTCSHRSTNLKTRVTSQCGPCPSNNISAVADISLSRCSSGLNFEYGDMDHHTHMLYVCSNCA